MWIINSVLISVVGYVDHKGNVPPEPLTKEFIELEPSVLGIFNWYILKDVLDLVRSLWRKVLWG